MQGRIKNIPETKMENSHILEGDCSCNGHCMTERGGINELRMSLHKFWIEELKFEVFNFR